MPDYQNVRYGHIGNESAEDLTHLGIEIRSPQGSTYISEDRQGFWKEIGRIVVWPERNRIDVYPYELLSGAELGHLRDAAWGAWMNRPNERRPKYWTRRTHHVHGCYYECAISIEAFKDDRVVRMIQAARSFPLWQDQQFQQIYDATT